MVNATRGMIEVELMKQVNDGALRAGVEDIHVRAVNKLSSGHLAIQTRNVEEAVRLKDNKAWVISVYEEEGRTVVKIYSVLVYTHKMKMFREMDLDKFRSVIKVFNAGLESMHVASLQGGRQDDKGFFILIFRTKKEANEAIQNGIVIEGRIHTAKVYNRKCRVKRCFKCYKYGHLSPRCTNKQCRSRCSHAHAIPMRGDSHSECSKENPDRCAACGKAHPAWSKECETLSQNFSVV